jgi:hypothetical protein
MPETVFEQLETLTKEEIEAREDIEAEKIADLNERLELGEEAYKKKKHEEFLDKDLYFFEKLRSRKKT